MVSFKVSKKDSELIDRIAIRASRMYKNLYDLGLITSDGALPNYPTQDAAMDITAVHANDTRLRLSELAEADDANFGHDVFGIRRHLDRSTGQLTNFFVPRFAE